MSVVPTLLLGRTRLVPACSAETSSCSPVIPCRPGSGAEARPRAVTYAASGPVSRTPATRSALLKARRRSALARQAGSSCRYAPRPGRRCRGSGTRVMTPASTTATTR